MESRFAQRLMMTLMVIGFIMSAAYALSSSRHHKDADPPAATSEAPAAN
ncbi:MULTISPECIES: hypothetical protein [unclassified Rhizobium]|nr:MULTISPECIES: hypothetical protein [unclassified Rhizobium]MBO9099919.1 hypothetical protein [Rhizobium sp. L58/93]MBO9131538.1 hypothetical protein [Rhizobium sp. B209b/85]MBO9169908.1 hypothetical protein [Rhizobium sp. L245/93]MBO9185866.1 hypothetical protein [Rhizobium sp. E27B/91]QXZ82627.1 hypothetical protein J5287_10970 [Rhizobium sp. K1/93]